VIDGMVDKRVELGFDDLLAMGLDEYAVTMTCVSNEVGGTFSETRSGSACRCATCSRSPARRRG
jgi:hypothetical protein